MVGEQRHEFVLWRKIAHSRRVPVALVRGQSPDVARERLSLEAGGALIVFRQ